MSDLTELLTFVGARLGEDEAAAAAIIAGPYPRGRLADIHKWIEELSPDVLDHYARHDPDQVSREAEATRRTMGLYESRAREMEANRRALVELQADIDREERGEEVVGSTATRGRAIGREYDYLSATLLDLGAALKFRAAVWSDHPNYQSEWRA